MAVEFQTGFTDRDFIEADIANWHLEVFNRSGAARDITLTVYDKANTVIGTATFTDLPNNGFTSLTVPVNQEHTRVVITHDGTGFNTVLFTLYGRNSAGNTIAGATYRHTELIQISSTT